MVSVKMCITTWTGPLTICKSEVFIMISTDTTALCRRYPPINLQDRAYPFLALILKFFKKLTKGKVGDLFSPKVGLFSFKNFHYWEQMKLLTRNKLSRYLLSAQGICTRNTFAFIVNYRPPRHIS